MTMIQCAECNQNVSSTANACPHCGAKVPKPKTWLWFVIGIPVAVVVASMIQQSSPEAKEKSRQRDAISLCNEELKKNPGNSIIIGACAMAENEFKLKWNERP